MMCAVPRPPLLLGLAGLLPFLAGALIVATGFEIPYAGHTALGDGRAILVQYGIVIQAFMSGVLWGFATKSDRAPPYVLSVLPALWVFFFATGPEARALLNIALGFIALLGLDAWFMAQSLAPAWWLRLRLLLTAIVVPCLLIGAYL
jgi:hypothetical protein